jgi:serine O-acetyltransferase
MPADGLRETLRLAAEDRRTNHDAFTTRVLMTTYRLGRYITRRRAASRSRLGRLAWRLALEPGHRLHQLLSLLVGCEVPYTATIGRRLRLVHGFHGVFLSVRASIGDDVTMLHHVTVGSDYAASGELSAPSIGDGVFIGVGAVLIGGIRVGNHARIGARAIVVTDVPDNATAISPKAVIRERSGPRPIERAIPDASKADRPRAG